MLYQNSRIEEHWSHLQLKKSRKSWIRQKKGEDIFRPGTWDPGPNGMKDKKRCKDLNLHRRRRREVFPQVRAHLSYDNARQARCRPWGTLSQDCTPPMEKKTFMFDNLLEESPGVKDNGLVPLWFQFPWSILLPHCLDPRRRAVSVLEKRRYLKEKPQPTWHWGITLLHFLVSFKYSSSPSFDLHSHTLMAPITPFSPL